MACVGTATTSESAMKDWTRTKGPCASYRPIAKSDSLRLDLAEAAPWEVRRKGIGCEGSGFPMGAIEMDEKLLKLRQQLHAKTMEIQAFVAKHEGMSDLKDLDPAVFQRLRSHVEKLLEEWEEAYTKGH